MTLRQWIRWELKYYPSYFKQGIKNLIKWFPVIWKNRDWDHAYIDYILLFKLKQMYSVLKNGHAAPLPANPRHWKGVKAMKICITILERKNNSFYYQKCNPPIRELDFYKRDWKLFCKLFEIYHDYWWD